MIAGLKGKVNNDDAVALISAQILSRINGIVAVEIVEG